MSISRYILLSVFICALAVSVCGMSEATLHLAVFVNGNCISSEGSHFRSTIDYYVGDNITFYCHIENEPSLELFQKLVHKNIDGSRTTIPESYTEKNITLYVTAEEKDNNSEVYCIVKRRNKMTRDVFLKRSAHKKLMLHSDKRSLSVVTEAQNNEVETLDTNNETDIRSLSVVTEAQNNEEETLDTYNETGLPLSAITAVSVGVMVSVGLVASCLLLRYKNQKKRPTEGTSANQDTDLIYDYVYMHPRNAIISFARRAALHIAEGDECQKHDTPRREDTARGEDASRQEGAECQTQYKNQKKRPNERTSPNQDTDLIYDYVYMHPRNEIISFAVLINERLARPQGTTDHQNDAVHQEGAQFQKCAARQKTAPRREDAARWEGTGHRDNAVR